MGLEFPQHKYCSFCKIEHPLSSEYWIHNQCKLYKKYILRNWQIRNRDKVNADRRNYYCSHKELVIQTNYKYCQKRRKVDPGYNLDIILRQRFTRALKKNWKLGSAVSDLGCSIEDCRKYLEGKFQPGMTWHNLTRDGWHVDHILPLSKFDLSDRDQVKLALHYTNLQPLWSEDNLKKSNKLSPHI